jgi:hypothetical protein
LFFRCTQSLIASTPCVLAVLDAASSAVLLTCTPPHPLYVQIAAAVKRWAKVIKRDVFALALALFDGRTPFIARVISFATV